MRDAEISETALPERPGVETTVSTPSIQRFPRLFPPFSTVFFMHRIGRGPGPRSRRGCAAIVDDASVVRPEARSPTGRTPLGDRGLRL